MKMMFTFDKVKILEQIRKLLTILKPSEYHVQRSIEKWIVFGCKYFYVCEYCHYVTCYTRFEEYLRCPYCGSKLEFLPSTTLNDLVRYFLDFINHAVNTYENVLSNVIDVFRKYGELETFYIDVQGVKVLRPEIHFGRSTITKVTIHFLRRASEHSGSEVYMYNPKNYRCPIELLNVVKELDDLRLFKIKIVTTNLIEYVNIFVKTGYKFVPPYTLVYIP